MAHTIKPRLEPPNRRLRRAAGVAAIACTAAALLLPGSALAAFPGVNGRIAFAASDGPYPSASDEAIFTMNPGGSGASQLTATQHSDRSRIAYDLAPSYAPSGKQLVFTHEASAKVSEDLVEAI